MCGIAGIVRFDGAPVDPGLLRSMSDRLEHRGPDDRGVWTDGPVGFAHRRLSIIDPAGSSQPMASEDGRFHLAFNGEILNYRELRRWIPYRYRTDGDTETLLAGFGLRGPDIATDLVGQFAFAVHDAVQRSVWLCRDRLGVLPLHYYLDDEQLVFASEIKAILPALPQRPQVDHEGLAAYLAHRSVPSPRTLFSGIRKLPPGHGLRVDLDGAIRLERWWAIPEEDSTRRMTPQQAVAAVSRSLQVSVERNLVADVPVGAYLSGGLDSSVITALAARRSGADRIHTFAAGFGDPDLDELHHAQRVSDHLGTRHHEVIVTADDFESLWPDLTWFRDAPVSEPADVAVYRLAQLARTEVKVVLSGEGSDELFGGYPKHRMARVGALSEVVPAPVRAAAADGLAAILPERLNRARIALRALGAADEPSRLEGWFAPFTPQERAALLGGDGRRAGDDIKVGRGDPLRRMLHADCHSWLADNLLERGDRMSMAASLELRPPFLDRDVVELAFSIPSALKVRHGTTKWVVKEVARGLLPDEIIDRPKSGFRVPIARWLRGSMRDLAHDRLLDTSSFTCEVFDRGEVMRLLDSHTSGARNEDIRIWTLLSLEMWHQRFASELA